MDSALHFFANKEVFIPSKHPNVRRHKNQEEKKEIQRRDRCLGVTDAWTRQMPGHDEAPGAEWDVRRGTRCQGGVWRRGEVPERSEALDGGSVELEREVLRKRG